MDPNLAESAKMFRRVSAGSWSRLGWSRLGESNPLPIRVFNPAEHVRPRQLKSIGPQPDTRFAVHLRIAQSGPIRDRLCQESGDCSAAELVKRQIKTSRKTRKAPATAVTPRGMADRKGVDSAETTVQKHSPHHNPSRRLSG